MTTQFTSAAGAELHVSAAAPGTENESGYGALSYSEITLVDNVGEIGPTDDLVTFTPAKDGITQKGQGPRNFGSTTVNMAYATTEEAGVGILRTAHDGRNLVSVKRVYPDGAIRYFQARCMGVREVTGGAGDVIALQTTLEITTKLVRVAGS